MLITFIKINVTLRRTIKMINKKMSLKKSDLMAFAERFNEALDDMKVPVMGRGRQSFAADLFGRSHKAARRWIMGEGYPEKTEWIAIATMLSVRMEWLFFGLGPKRNGRNKKSDGYNRKVLEVVINSVNAADIKATKKTRTELALSIYDSIIDIT